MREIRPQKTGSDYSRLPKKRPGKPLLSQPCAHILLPCLLPLLFEILLIKFKSFYNIILSLAVRIVLWNIRFQAVPSAHPKGLQAIRLCFWIVGAVVHGIPDYLKSGCPADWFRRPIAFILPFHKNKPNARLSSVWLCMRFGYTNLNLKTTIS